MKNIRSVCLVLAMSFLLGIHNGQVALWKEGAADPVKVFPCPAAALPRDAREALEKGIRVESTRELEALAENYLS